MWILFCPDFGPAEEYLGRATVPVNASLISCRESSSHGKEGRKERRREGGKKGRKKKTKLFCYPAPSLIIT